MAVLLLMTEDHWSAKWEISGVKESVIPLFGDLGVAGWDGRGGHLII